jgi:hypothetical protein
VTHITKVCVRAVPTTDGLFLDGIERSQLAFLGFALTTQARVQAHRSSVLALNEWVPISGRFRSMW